MSISDGRVTIPSPPRTNLPLPHELRDQIWALLLRSEHVHDNPYHFRPLEERGQVKLTNVHDEKPNC